MIAAEFADELIDYILLEHETEPLEALLNIHGSDHPSLVRIEAFEGEGEVVVIVEEVWVDDCGYELSIGNQTALSEMEVDHNFVYLIVVLLGFNILKKLLQLVMVDGPIMKIVQVKEGVLHVGQFLMIIEDADHQLEYLFPKGVAVLELDQSLED